jgi:hypothetical protein
VGLERGPLSLVRIIEELLEWKSSGSDQENRINGRRDPLRCPRDTLYPQKLELTSPTSSGRSVGIVRLRTKGHGVLGFSEIFHPLCPFFRRSPVSTFDLHPFSFSTAISTYRN